MKNGSKDKVDFGHLSRGKDRLELSTRKSWGASSGKRRVMQLNNRKPTKNFGEVRENPEISSLHLSQIPFLYLWFNSLCPSKRYAVLIPSICECNLSADGIKLIQCKNKK